PSRIQITSLSAGSGARPAGGWSRERAVLAVVDGDGAADLFAAEGAHVLRPEADAPVSAKQLLHALVNTGAAQIMVLPNGYVAAEELVAGCAAAIGWGGVRARWRSVCGLPWGDGLGRPRRPAARRFHGSGPGRARGTRRR